MPKRCVFYLSESVEAKLDNLANSLGMTTTQVVERAISSFSRSNGGDPVRSDDTVSVSEEELQRLIESI